MNETREKAILWALQCRNSFIRFLDFVYLFDPAKKSVIPMEKWPHLMEVADVLLSHRLIVILKARQIGISWLLAAYALWQAMFHEQAVILMLSLGEREAGKLLGKCKFIYSHLPEELKFPTTVNSATVLGFMNGSEIDVLPSTEDAGRSEAATVVICDEWDYHAYAEENYAAAKPAIDAGGQFIGVSTRNINKAETFMVQTYMKAKRGANNFKALFYGCFCRPGRDESWYKEQAAEYTTARLRSEYPRTEDEALTPIEQTLVFRDSIARLKSGILPEKVGTKPFVHIFHEPVSGWRYVCGVDVAEGQGEDHDYSVATIIGSKGLFSTVCAVIRTNELRPDVFAREVYELCQEYFNPLLCYENNGLGIAFGQKMMELKYPKLYYQTDRRGKKTKAGINTTRESKKAMITDLASATMETLSIPYKEMADEMCNMQWMTVKNQFGQETVLPVAPNKEHDDCVLSCAIAYQMLSKVPMNTPMPKLRYRKNSAFAMR